MKILWTLRVFPALGRGYLPSPVINPQASLSLYPSCLGALSSCYFTLILVSMDFILKFIRQPNPRLCAYYDSLNLISALKKSADINWVVPVGR